MAKQLPTNRFTFEVLNTFIEFIPLYELLLNFSQ